MKSFNTRKFLSLLNPVLWMVFAVIKTADGWGTFRQQFPSKYPPMVQNGVDPGEPLFLTPYIERGDIATGQRLSQVGMIKGVSQKSYAGFLTVQKKYNSNLFFWFFPAQTNPENAPVLLWLQGGPGGSSLFGLFVETGPIGVDKNNNVYQRNVTWNSKYSMLYIDNPVGTGFSFTEDDAGYARNEADVAVNLYEGLIQFFKLFPTYSKNQLYLTGESYAGKYVPSLAHFIHQHPNPRELNLRGIAVGDGFSDPETMLPCYADFLFHIGMLDENEREYFRNQTNIAVKLIQQKKFKAAFQEWDSLLNGDTGGPSWFFNVTGAKDYYNYMRTISPAEFDYYPNLLALPEIRRAIHVGNLTYNSGEKVEQMIVNDIMDSVKPWLAEVMNYYKVMLYSGNLDIIVALPLTEGMLQTVPWQYLDEYKRAKKSVWKVHPTDTEVAGYVRRVHDFYQVAVRGGGHILPYDQPERSFDMIDRFITGRPFA